MRILNVTLQNGGTYNCQAVNAAGSTSMSATIEVSESRERMSSYRSEEKSLLSEPEYLHSRRQSDKVTVVTGSGDDVDLNCRQNNHAHGQTDIVWSRDDGVSIDNQHQVVGGMLRLVNPTINDSGHYTCEVLKPNYIQ